MRILILLLVSISLDFGSIAISSEYELHTWWICRFPLVDIYHVANVIPTITWIITKILVS